VADEIQITPALLDAVAQAEDASGDPRVVNPKSGAVGKYQILPSTAAMFGVPRAALFDPTVSRNLAGLYLTKLARQYGNLPQALAVYHGEAGADKGYSAPSSYVRGILNRIGATPAYAGEVPYTGPILSEKPKTETLYSGPILSEKPKHIRMEIKKEIPLPLSARAAGYLPAVGQFSGEILGAGGAALTPGIGETGVGEYAGAVAGGAGGSALGAAAENAIRKAYGLPPVSIGNEALIGGGTSAIGGLLPPVLRTRAATALGRATKRAFGPALEAAQGLKGELGRVLGKASDIGARGFELARGYRGTLQAGLKRLGEMYDDALRPFEKAPMTNAAARQVVRGEAGETLRLANKPVRKAIIRMLDEPPSVQRAKQLLAFIQQNGAARTPQIAEMEQHLVEEINAGRLTVPKMQKVLSFLRQQMRALDKNKDRAAISAMGDIEKAIVAERNAIVGPAVAKRLNELDAQYAQKLADFPLRAVGKQTRMAGVAEAILKSNPSEIGRNLQVIAEMTAHGDLPALREATAAKIFAAGEAKTGLNEADRIVNVRKAVEAVPRQIFDKIYGQGARDSWLQLAKDFEAKQAEILKNPTEAKAIQAEVQKFLQSPTAGQAAYNYLKHHLGWVALGLATGHYGAGVPVGAEAGLAVGALFGIKMWEGIAHSRLAMHYMEQAATSKSTERTARMIFAAIDAAMHAGVQEQTAETTVGVNP
jgi:soluble lytic murein transglycosylase-like protein